MTRVKKPLPKPLLKPSAQTARLCAVRNESEPAFYPIKGNNELPQHASPTEKAVILLMQATGCRISEVLNIGPSDVSSNGTIKLKAKKGSSDRIIYAGAWSEYFVKNRLSLPLTAQGFNRFFFYRQFIKYGIYATIGNRKKQSVTHFYRHKLAADLRHDNFEVEKIGQALGHKRVTNSNRYGK